MYIMQLTHQLHYMQLQVTELSSNKNQRQQFFPASFVTGSKTAAAAQDTVRPTVQQVPNQGNSPNANFRGKWDHILADLLN